MVGGDSRGFYFSYRPPCVQRMDQPSVMGLKEKPNVITKSHCTYCKSTRHKVANCGDFKRDYLRPQPQQLVRQPLPQHTPAHPPSDQMDEDQLGEKLFEGYDMPGVAQGGNTGGAGCGQPPRSANVAGGDNPCDSTSSSSDSD